ncbi:tetratricopeptide repeat protein [Oceanibium sediminis]|uniref:tetratricopeptide repeat protein n=1 Tax=Oceanibium sediminis TaxID=2026339 RepID=UPI001E5EECA7|nr:tetratricopeptide repeat protein [Oceanibium sediminis]
MNLLRNPVLTIVVALAFAASPASAQEEMDEADIIESRPADDIDSLLAELADPDLRTWEATEARIIELWSRSGSATADLLLERGMNALEAEDYLTAVEHLTALTDHAPDFAEGWHARATAFYLQEEFGLAVRDLQRALVLNPRHFGALTGLGIVLEELGDYELALRALELAEDLNPHRATVTDGIARLKARIGESTL